MIYYFVANGDFDGDGMWDWWTREVFPLLPDNNIKVICCDDKSLEYFSRLDYNVKRLPNPTINLDIARKVAMEYRGFYMNNITEYDKWQSYHWGIYRKTTDDINLIAQRWIDRWQLFFDGLKSNKFTMVLFAPYPSFRKIPELMTRLSGNRVLYINEYFGRVYLDKVGFSQRSSINHVWHTLKNRLLGQDQQKYLNEAISAFHQAKSSRRNSDGKALNAYDSKESMREALGLPIDSKIILMLEQFPYDGNKIIHSPIIKTRDEYITPIVKMLETVEDKWYVVVKKHPEDTVSRNDEFTDCFESNPERCRLAFRTNIHNLLEYSEVVITLNSMAGLEALTYHKPVITIANAIYANKGFTFDVHSLSDYTSIVKVALAQYDVLPSQLQCRDIDNFLYYLMFETGDGKWE